MCSKQTIARMETNPLNRSPTRRLPRRSSGLLSQFQSGSWRGLTRWLLSLFCTRPLSMGRSGSISTFVRSRWDPPCRYCHEYAYQVEVLLESDSDATCHLTNPHTHPGFILFIHTQALYCPEQQSWHPDILLTRSDARVEPAPRRISSGNGCCDAPGSPLGAERCSVGRSGPVVHNRPQGQGKTVRC
jgi:hypothetical protein